MIITFNELRRIKDRLPSGSSQRIADELGLDVETVRNYFGGKHFDAKGSVGVHFEQGPDGGVVTLDDTAILDAAMRCELPLGSLSLIRRNSLNVIIIVVNFIMC